MTDPTPDPAAHSAESPAPAGFAAGLRGHWLVRLAVRAMAFGVTPLVLYETYHWATGGPSPRSVDLGALAFVGMGLGALLIVAGILVVGLNRVRAGRVRSPR